MHVYKYGVNGMSMLMNKNVSGNSEHTVQIQIGTHTLYTVPSHPHAFVLYCSLSLLTGFCLGRGFWGWEGGGLVEVGRERCTLGRGLSSLRKTTKPLTSLPFCHNHHSLSHWVHIFIASGAATCSYCCLLQPTNPWDYICQEHPTNFALGSAST